MNKILSMVIHVCMTIALLCFFVWIPIFLIMSMPVLVATALIYVLFVLLILLVDKLQDYMFLRKLKKVLKNDQ